MTADPIGSTCWLPSGSVVPRRELEVGAAGDMDPVRQAIAAGHRVVITASAELAENVTDGTCTPGLRAAQPWILRYADLVVVVLPQTRLPTMARLAPPAVSTSKVPAHGIGTEPRRR